MRRLSAVVAVCITATSLVSAQRGQQPSRFRSTADAVQVDVQVRQGARPVVGLTAADFELRDSGVRQQVKAFAFEDVPLSLLLVLDASASVKGEKLEFLKSAARSAVSALRRDDQASLLVFSQRIELISGWTSDQAALASAIDRIAPRGFTSMHDAIFTSVLLRERAAGRTVVIVFTDGRDTASWLGARATLDAALRSDIVFYAVSTGAPPVLKPARGKLPNEVLPRSLKEQFDTDPSLYPYALLDKMTEQTGGELVRLTSMRDLSGVFLGIVKDFKTRYLLTYIPTGVPASGWHPIDVTLRNKSAKVTARRGYAR
jgi:VWFA-related protein